MCKVLNLTLRRDFLKLPFGFISNDVKHAVENLIDIEYSMPAACHQMFFNDYANIFNGRTQESLFS